MEQILGNMVSIYSFYTVAEANAALYTPKFLKSLNLSGLPAHWINMKIGAPTYTVAKKNLHCNGAMAMDILL